MSTATYAARRNQNLYRSKAELQLGPVSASMVMVAVVAALALLYLTQITKTSVFGSAVSDLQNQRTQALAAKQELEVEAARMSSIQQIQSSKAVSTLVPTASATYVKN